MSQTPISRDDDLRIEFRRHGGFAGIGLTSTVVAGTPDPDADAVRAMLSRIDLEALPPATPSSGGADLFSYDLDITLGGRRTSLSYREDDLPEALRPLVEFLVRRAKRGDRPES